jgi:Zn-dependent protease with chaperone function
VTHLALASLALAFFLLLPWVLEGRGFERASPRLLTAAYLIALLALALLPAGWLACLGTALVGLAVGGGSPTAECWLGLDGRSWRLVADAVALGALVPLAWQGVRLGVRTWRAEPRRVELATADRRCLRSGGTVWVIPSEQPIAYAGGVVQPRAIITTGLLAMLGPLEQEAVLEHEAAHVRLGHPRLLLLGAAVERAYGFLPPVRRAWDGLSREAEVTADEEAVRLVGRLPLLTALAQVGLARASAGAASFTDAHHLRYRIRRLQEPASSDPRASWLVGTLGAVLVAGLSWSICAFLGDNPTTGGLVVCALGVTAIGLRPTWRWRHRQPASGDVS